MTATTAVVLVVPRPGPVGEGPGERLRPLGPGVVDRMACGLPPVMRGRSCSASPGSRGPASPLSRHPSSPPSWSRGPRRCSCRWTASTRQRGPCGSWAEPSAREPSTPSTAPGSPRCRAGLRAGGWTRCGRPSTTARSRSPSPGDRRARGDRGRGHRGHHFVDADRGCRARAPRRGVGRPGRPRPDGPSGSWRARRVRHWSRRRRGWSPSTSATLLVRATALARADPSSAPGERPAAYDAGRVGGEVRVARGPRRLRGDP